MRLHDAAVPGALSKLDLGLGPALKIIKVVERHLSPQLRSVTLGASTILTDPAFLKNALTWIIPCPERRP